VLYDASRHLVVVAFQGTDGLSNLENVVTDFDARWTYRWAGHLGESVWDDVWVHQGFIDAYEELQGALYDRLDRVHAARLKDATTSPAELVIVGHSLGGAIAQHIAVHAPERVEKLVLSASWAGPHPAFLKLFELRKAVLQAAGPEAYMLQGNLLGNPGWWAMANHGAMMAGIKARLEAFAGVDIEMERMDAVTSHDLRDRVGGIAAETLVICARDDGITPLPLSEELARLIPNARLEVLPSGNHFAPVTTPEDWRAPVSAFLA